jgi:hypothetical protein
MEEDGNCTDRLDLFEHLRKLDLARTLLLDLQRMVDTCPPAEPACKAMAMFAADVMDDAEAGALLRNWGGPQRARIGAVTERLRTPKGGSAEAETR